MIPKPETRLVYTDNPLRVSNLALAVHLAMRFPVIQVRKHYRQQRAVFVFERSPAAETAITEWYAMRDTLHAEEERVIGAKAPKAHAHERTD